MTAVLPEPRSALVIGASGHVGAAVTRRLVDAGWSATIMLRATSDRSRLGPVLSKVRTIYADLTRVDECRDEIIALAPTVIYFAGWHGVTSQQRNSPEQITINIPAFLSLLQIARVARTRRFVGIGSQAEYGPCNSVITEATPCRPVSAYGAAKFAASSLGAEYCRRVGLEFVWLRLFSAYGPADDATHMLPQLICGLLGGTPPPLTSGVQPWEYLYIDDVADAIVAAATAPKALGIFNLSSGEPVTVRSVIEQVRDLIDPKIALSLGQVPLSNEASWGIRADISRLCTATGWHPRTPIAVGLAETVHWFRARQRPPVCQEN